MLISLLDKSWRWTVVDGSYSRFATSVFLLAFCCIAFAQVTFADTVKSWVDKEGRLHYSNEEKNKKAVAPKTSSHPHGWTDAHGRRVYSDRTRKTISSERHRVLRLTQCMLDVTEIISGPVATAANSGRVVLLTAKWCAPSKKARAYLKKNKIKFVEYDVDRQKAGRILYTQLARRGVPVMIAGSQRMFGFRADLAKRILLRSGHLSSVKKKSVEIKVKSKKR